MLAARDIGNVAKLKKKVAVDISLLTDVGFSKVDIELITEDLQIMKEGGDEFVAWLCEATEGTMQASAAYGKLLAEANISSQNKLKRKLQKQPTFLVERGFEEDDAGLICEKLGIEIV